mgnify:CR=1 FL=1
MSYQLVAEGDKADLYDIGKYEAQFAETQRGKLTLKTYADIPDGVASAIEWSCKTAGVQGCKVVTGPGTVDIYFTKGSPALILLLSIILAVTVLMIVLVTWQLFKEVGPIGSNLMLIAGFLAVGMVFYSFAKKEAPAIKGGIQSGIAYAKQEAPNIKKNIRSGIAYLKE